jgi:hypothetical protein
MIVDLTMCKRPLWIVLTVTFLLKLSRATRAIELSWVPGIIGSLGGKRNRVVGEKNLEVCYAGDSKYW